MAKKHKNLELRERLDKTLASPGLANESSIKSLVKNQLLRSPFPGSEVDLMTLVDKRSAEVSNFVEMLRSASSNDKVPSRTSHTEWKMKQDTEQLRVMYREGPHGSPFHTLLAEGYADGPIDVCLCVSWEATLYKKWWPQYNIPSFKIIMSTCLQKVRIGEEISLVRVKVPWPMSDREALLHYFELEYLEEDLLIVLINTISEENIDLSTRGFMKDGIPEMKDAVRIDMVGGFVLQKISPTRCYFRATANMDIKLDFMPPSLINFISRQLIGNGHKLYQKAVASVAATDEDYREALKGEMYDRAREGMDLFHKSTTMLVDIKDEDKSTVFLTEEHDGKSATNAQATDDPLITEGVDPFYKSETMLVGIKDKEKSTVFHGEQCEVGKLPTNTDKPCTGEIEEEEEEHDVYIEANQAISDSQTNVTASQSSVSANLEHHNVSPEVENALNTLDEAVAIFRKLGSAEANHIEGWPSHLELKISEYVEEAASLNEMDEPKNNAILKPPHEAIDSPVFEKFRHGEVNTMGCSRDQQLSLTLSSTKRSVGSDVGRLRTSTKEGPTDDASWSGSRSRSPSHEGPTDANVSRSQPLTLDHMSKVFDEVNAEVNGARGSDRYEAIHTKKQKKKKKKKQQQQRPRFFSCCLLGFNKGQGG